MEVQKLQETANKIKQYFISYDYFEVIVDEEKFTITIKTIWNDVSLDLLLDFRQNKLWYKSFEIEINDLWCVLYENTMDHYEIIMNRLQKVTNVN